ncbi:GIY-YIG nuclease family protein [Halopelagius longus]|uniref:GIY-YIG nuclease family protein n=1 Tax=Halopelagius longus TaxID=1236180 RepID=A0A1H1A9T0_9EURY|nr:GIY-YIG nuclease family protein [Halopelagius longus]RDI70296.1 GIY-YIG nuclease family protein [Halopelagius longus]SDQ36423.1 Uri superfamily endonuclease [Halopelagius longus]
MDDAETRPVVLDPAAIRAGEDELGIGANEAPPGTYSLVYELNADAGVEVGALGECEFPAGAYAYVGSAHGSNGLGRVERHCRVASGDHEVRHWHVDYLGGHPSTDLAAVVASSNVDVDERSSSGRRGSPGDIECRVARRLGGSSDASPSAVERPLSSPVSGFGSSDCDCDAHLVSGEEVETILSAVVESFEGKE